MREYAPTSHRRRAPEYNTDVAPLLRRTPNPDDPTEKPVGNAPSLFAESIEDQLPYRIPNSELLQGAGTSILDIDAILAANTAAPVDVGLPEPFSADMLPSAFESTEDTLDLPQTLQEKPLYLAPIDSSSLVAEATVVAEEAPSSESKLQRLAFHEAKLYEALGQRYSRDDLLYRSFSVAKDVTNLELAEDEDARIRELRMMPLNIQTNLVERVKAETVLITYAVEGEKVFAELPSHEPGGEKSKVLVSKMIQEGIDYRLQHGTVEGEREQAEQTGWLNLEVKLADPQTEIGTTFTVFSPKSSVTELGEKGAYDKSFINNFTVREKDGKRYVEMVQRDVDLDEQGYRDAAESLDPQFFVEYDAAEEKPALDAYYLARPVQGKLPLELTEGKRMSLHTFESKDMYNDPLLQGMIDYYIQGVKDAVQGLPDNPDWIDLCKRLNAILNLSDRLEAKVREREASNVVQTRQIYPQDSGEPLSQREIQAAVQSMGRRTPIEKGGAGCPTNKGYDIGGTSVLSPSIPGGSVALFSPALIGEIHSSSEKKTLCCICPFCDKKVEAVIANDTITCPSCKKSAPYEC